MHNGALLAMKEDPTEDPLQIEATHPTYYVGESSGTTSEEVVWKDMCMLPVVRSHMPSISPLSPLPSNEYFEELAQRHMRWSRSCLATRTPHFHPLHCQGCQWECMTRLWVALPPTYSQERLELMSQRDRQPKLRRPGLLTQPGCSFLLPRKFKERWIRSRCVLASKCAHYRQLTSTQFSERVQNRFLSVP